MEPEDAAETRISNVPEAHSGPWLVSLHGENKRTQSFFSLTQDRWHERSISMMETHIFCPTPQGWLLIRDSEAHRCFLWNPSTLAKISLPYPPKGALVPRRSQCILSSEPADPHCTVMYVNNEHHKLFFCHRTSKHWTEHELDDEWRYCDAIFFKGIFYLATGRNLGVIDLDPIPRITLVVNEEDPIQYRFATRFCVLESCGEMFQVENYAYVFSDITRPADIVVLKMDFDKKEWVVVDSIGSDRVFFIGIGNPFELNASRSASALGVKGDCIYYIHDDEGLYMYDLEKETMSSDLTCQYMKDDGPPPFWLMPSM